MTVSPSSTPRPSACSGLVARGALAQPLQRQLDGLVGDDVVGARERQGGVVAGFKWRHRVERRRKRERLVLFDVDVADVRRVDGFHAAFPQRVVHGPRNQVVREVVKNFALVALLDDTRRRLAGTEPRHLGALRVVAREAIELGIDDIGRNFDLEILARVVDVCELCFHRGISPAYTEIRARPAAAKITTNGMIGSPNLGSTYAGSCAASTNAGRSQSGSSSRARARADQTP